MGHALDQAQIALEQGEVPVGCVIVLGGRIIGRGWNRIESAGDPTAHAEILAISAASATLGHTRLEGARAYVTIEPCLMCAGAFLLARVEEVVYGAPEPKFGAIESRLRVLETIGLNHRFRVRRGVRAEESAHLLQGFFRALRREGRSAGDPGE
jgi:tRNA(adenine34) deaminase